MSALKGWKRLGSYETKDRNAIHWLIRHAKDNGIVDAGVVCKFGRSWYVHEERLPDFLVQRTQKEIQARGDWDALLEDGDEMDVGGEP
jgi:hypothetical protein